MDQGCEHLSVSSALIEIVLIFYLALKYKGLILIEWNQVQCCNNHKLMGDGVAG